MTIEEMPAPKFETLVAFILEQFDKASVRAAKPDATRASQVEAETLRGVLHWVQGYANVSIDELREKYGDQS